MTPIISKKARICGQVLSSDGRPIEDVSIMISESIEQHHDIVIFTDEFGKFCFEDLHPGKYIILLNFENGQQIKETFIISSGESANRVIYSS